MSQDIVSEMAREMNLNPSMLDSLQQQQQQAGGYGAPVGGPGMPSGGGPPGVGGPGMPPGGGAPGGFGQMSPEQQMAMLQAAQQPPMQQQQQMPPQQYEETSSEDSTESSGSASAEMNLDKLGLTGKQKSVFDNILSKLKGPLVVVVLFVIFSLAQVDGLFKQVLPAVINNNTYYYLGLKGLAVGVVYLGSSLFIEE